MLLMIQTIKCLPSLLLIMSKQSFGACVFTYFTYIHTIFSGYELIIIEWLSPVFMWTQPHILAILLHVRSL